MNNTNNFTLMKRIDDFKKRYNELLLELDNSSFLNITKFTNSDWLEANHDDNISSLLEENNQVNKNLQIIKNSIKEKIKNLELLSEKVRNRPDVAQEELISTFEELIHNEKTDFENSKNMSLFRVYDDIERTISKIDRVKEYIEDKVLIKIEESENEKLILNKALEELNAKVKNLLKDKKINEDIIMELKMSNNELQRQCDQTIESWLSLSSQLDNLHLLVDHNTEEMNSMNHEKDKLIIQLENKINDLLFEKSHVETTESPSETYKNNVADILMDAIHKIFVDLLQEFFSNETKYNAKLKAFKNHSSNLLQKIDDINDTNETIKNSILDIQEYDVDKIHPNNDYYSIFNSVKNLDELKDLFNDYYRVKIRYLLATVDDVKAIINSIKNRFENNLNAKSNKKINWLISEYDAYQDKMNVFLNQIKDLEKKALDFNANKVTTGLFDDPYWSNLSVFFDENIKLLNDDLRALKDINKIYENYLVTGTIVEQKHDSPMSIINQHEEYSNNKQMIENGIEDKDNNINHQNHESKNLVNQDDEIVVEQENQSNTDNEFNNLVIENTQPIQEEEKVLVQEPDYNPDFSIIEETKTTTNIKETIEEPIIETSKVSNNIVQPIEETKTITNIEETIEEPIIKTSKASNNIVQPIEENTLKTITKEVIYGDDNFENQIDTIVEENINNNKSEELSKNLINQINDYVEYCGTSELEQNKDLIKIIEDKTRPLYNKIDNIEKILNELLKQNNQTTINISSQTNQIDSRYLLEKKYNKNLRLRLIKTRLYHLKLVLDAELDEKYLNIIKQLED